MSLDGNGSYSPPAPQFPAIPNTIIYADDFNQIILDIAAALSTAIFRDGQAAFTANQSMGGNKLTNLANGVNPQDATTVLQVFTDPVFIATTVQGFKVSGSMFQALMTTINLVASGTLKLTGTTLLDASASGEVRLPGNTSIGNVSATELGYLNGVTSSVQVQFDNITNTLLPGKVDKVGGTAQNLALTGTPTAPTAPVGTNSNQVATMAALISQAFAATLPNQAGNAGKFVTTNGANAYWAAIAPPQVIRVTRTSNATLIWANNGNLIDITSGTFTQTFNACSSLGNGWFCYIRNSGTGDIMLDPYSGELIDDLSSYIMYPGEVRLVQCDGTALRSVVLNAFYRVLTTSGTFTKPPGYRAFEGLLWAGGGSGRAGGNTRSGGGGGGACVPFLLHTSQVSASESVTIGAGGNAVAGTTNGLAGGNSVFSTVTAYGGGGGGSDFGGGGGGSLSAGQTGGTSSYTSTGGSPTTVGVLSGPNAFGGGNGTNSYTDTHYGGGGGGQGSNGGRGGNAFFGGGGGGGGHESLTTIGGVSKFGGGGGFGTPNGGAPGSAPGGGGGGSYSSAASGAGARGELRIWGVL